MGERHVISGHHIASGIGQIVGYRFEYIVIFSGRFVRQRNCIILNELSELSEKEGVETLYVRALDSSDSAIQNQAKAMLISRYMGRKEYERAQELLNSLPEQDFFDKNRFR